LKETELSLDEISAKLEERHRRLFDRLEVTKNEFFLCLSFINTNYIDPMLCLVEISTKIGTK